MLQPEAAAIRLASSGSAGLALANSLARSCPLNCKLQGCVAGKAVYWHGADPLKEALMASVYIRRVAPSKYGVSTSVGHWRMHGVDRKCKQENGSQATVRRQSTGSVGDAFARRINTRAMEKECQSEPRMWGQEV